MALILEKGNVGDTGGKVLGNPLPVDKGYHLVVNALVQEHRHLDFVKLESPVLNKGQVIVDPPIAAVAKSSTHDVDKVLAKALNVKQSSLVHGWEKGGHSSDESLRVVL